MTEQTITRIDDLIHSLPATEDELTTLLGSHNAVHRTVTAAKKAGHIIVKDHGVYASGGDSLALELVEHRELAYCATRLATAAGQFPRDDLVEAARLVASCLDAIEEPVRRARSRARLIARRENINRQLALLDA